MRYQSEAPSLAMVATDRDAEFCAQLRDTVRRIERSAACLAPHERQFLYDVKRADARYQLKTLRQLLAISARCTNRADAVAVPELCRGYVLAQRPTVLSVIEAFETETVAQAAADPAQWRFVRAPSPVSCDAALERLIAQEIATRAAIDALHANRQQLARAG